MPAIPTKTTFLRKLLAGLLLPIWEITEPIPPVQMEEWAPVGFACGFFEERTGRLLGESN
jgi:hypothetical protein